MIVRRLPVTRSSGSFDERNRGVRAEAERLRGTEGLEMHSTGPTRKKSPRRLGEREDEDLRLSEENDNQTAVKEAIRGLLSAQSLAVLATHSGGQPYASLVAFAATPDLTNLLFATTRATRKFANLSADSRAALLVDSRSNKEIDFETAAAVTAVGKVREAEKTEKEPLLNLYVAKHPHLAEFVRSPTCAFLRVEVKAYYLVRRFQEVMEWRPGP